MISTAFTRSLITPYELSHLKANRRYFQFQTLSHFYKTFQKLPLQSKLLSQQHCFSVLPSLGNNSIDSLSSAYFSQQTFNSSEQSYHHTSENKVFFPFIIGLMGASCLELKSVQANDALNEEVIAKNIKQAIKQKKPFEEMLEMKKLGDVYFRKNTPKSLIQAAGLYNYVHRIAVGNLKDNKEQESALQKLYLVEKRFLFLFSSSSKINQKQFSENRKKLKNFREKIDQEILSLKNSRNPKEVVLLHERIAQEVKQIVSDLIEQSIEMLGPPPCSFSAIGFGSLARKETTPYSDLEFGFLIEKDTPKNKEYFRCLTYLIHLRVVNLGETILPCLNISSLKGVFDKTTPRGFSFDGEGVQGKGCKTPFGDRKNFELIKTPSGMAKYQDKEWFSKQKHLSMELLNFCHLYGDEALSQEYKSKLNEQLSLPYDDAFTVRDYLTRNHLVQEDFDFFNPRLGDFDKEGQLFRAKNDFYRFPHLAIDRLSWIYSIEETSTFKRIQSLHKKKVLTKEAARRLKWLMSETMWARLEVYSYYKKQWDIMNPLLKPFGCEDPKLIREQFAIDKEGLKRIEKIYQVIIPFYHTMQRLLSENKNALIELQLQDDSLITKGAVAARVLQYDKAIEYYEKAVKKHPKDTNLLNQLGVLNYKKGNLDQAIKYIKEAIRIYIEIFGKNRNKTEIVEYYNNLALVYKDKGELETAIDILEKVKEIFSDFHTKNGLISLAKILNNLGSVCYAKRNLDGAIAHVEKSIEIIERIKKSMKLNKEDFFRANLALSKSYSNLAAIYQKKWNLDKAIEYLKKRVEIGIEELFGKYSPDTAISYNNLGMACKGKGDLKKAIELIKEALEINLKFFGEKSFNVAENYNNLALVYQEKGDLNGAVRLLKKALKINLDIFGEKSLSVARNYNNLGTIYRFAGYTDLAISCINKALEINIELLGRNSTETASSYNELGLTYLGQMELDKAIHLLEKALRINLQNLGEISQDVAKNYNNLGLVHLKKGDLGEAKKYIEKAEKIDKKLAFTKDDPRLARDYNNLAQVYQNEGSLDKALEYYKKALNINSNIFGEDNLKVSAGYHSKGVVYIHQNKLDQAINCIRKSLSIDNKILDSSSPYLALRYQSLGIVHQRKGELNQAIESINKALEINLKHFGENSFEIAGNYNSLGLIYKDKGDIDRAIYFLEKALDIDTKKFESDSPYLAKDYYNLGITYAKKNLTQAITYLELSLDIFEKKLGRTHFTTIIVGNELSKIKSLEDPNKT